MAQKWLGADSDRHNMFRKTKSPKVARGEILTGRAVKSQRGYGPPEYEKRTGIRDQGDRVSEQADRCVPPRWQGLHAGIAQWPVRLTSNQDMGVRFSLPVLEGSVINRYGAPARDVYNTPDASLVKLLCRSAEEKKVNAPGLAP